MLVPRSREFRIFPFDRGVVLFTNILHGDIITLLLRSFAFFAAREECSAHIAGRVALTVAFVDALMGSTLRLFK